LTLAEIADLGGGEIGEGFADGEAGRGGGIVDRDGRAFTHGHGLAGVHVEGAAVTAQSATGTCQGPTIWSRAMSPPTVRSPMEMRNVLSATVGWESTRRTASASDRPPSSRGRRAADSR
jgi:hypothetical protein